MKRSPAAGGDFLKRVHGQCSGKGIAGTAVPECHDFHDVARQQG